jgi:hypothetical protein
MKHTHRAIIDFIFWPIFFITHLLTFSLLAWHLLAQINFAYPLGYQLIGIDKHIQEFAPNNRFKQGFALTSPQQHWEAFAKITAAIQHKGKGLADISYTLPNGTHTPLMHTAEIIHLQDVANLIAVLYSIGLGCAVIWLLLLTTAYLKKFIFPAIKKILLGFFGGISLLTIIILCSGATPLFYWLHTKIFPDGHQWFFYYEDSLMTTLMEAPDIFAFIALLLMSLLIVLWLGSIWSMNKLLTPSNQLKKTNEPKKTSAPKHKHKKINKRKTIY